MRLSTGILYVLTAVLTGCAAFYLMMQTAASTTELLSCGSL
jgi:hypothetical protein